MKKLFPALALCLGFTTLVHADFLEIDGSVSYGFNGRVQFGPGSADLPLDLSSLPVTAMVQSALFQISLATTVEAFQQFPDPVTTFGQITIEPSGPPPVGDESWSSTLTQNFFLNAPATLNAAGSKYIIEPQFLVSGGTVDTTLVFSGENDLVECNPDPMGDCNLGALEPPFEISGEADAKLDIEYTLPGEAPEPGYLLLTLGLGLSMSVVAWRRRTAARN